MADEETRVVHPATQQNEGEGGRLADHSIDDHAQSQPEENHLGEQEGQNGAFFVSARSKSNTSRVEEVNNSAVLSQDSEPKTVNPPPNQQQFQRGAESQSEVVPTEALQGGQDSAQRILKYNGSHVTDATQEQNPTKMQGQSIIIEKEDEDEERECDSNYEEIPSVNGVESSSAIRAAENRAIRQSHPLVLQQKLIERENASDSAQNETVHQSRKFGDNSLGVRTTSQPSAQHAILQSNGSSDPSLQQTTYNQQVTGEFSKLGENVVVTFDNLPDQNISPLSGPCVEQLNGLQKFSTEMHGGVEHNIRDGSKIRVESSTIRVESSTARVESAGDIAMNKPQATYEGNEGKIQFEQPYENQRAPHAVLSENDGTQNTRSAADPPNIFQACTDPSSNDSNAHKPKVGRTSDSSGLVDLMLNNSTEQKSSRDLVDESLVGLKPQTTRSDADTVGKIMATNEIPETDSNNSAAMDESRDIGNIIPQIPMQQSHQGLFKGELCLDAQQQQQTFQTVPDQAPQLASINVKQKFIETDQPQFKPQFNSTTKQHPMKAGVGRHSPGNGRTSPSQSKSPSRLLQESRFNNIKEMCFAPLMGYKERMLGQDEFASLMKNRSGRRTSQYGIGLQQSSKLGFQFRNRKGAMRNIKPSSCVSSNSSHGDIGTKSHILSGVKIGRLTKQTSSAVDSLKPRLDGAKALIAKIQDQRSQNKFSPSHQQSEYSCRPIYAANNTARPRGHSTGVSQRMSHIPNTERDSYSPARTIPTAVSMIPPRQVAQDFRRPFSMGQAVKHRRRRGTYTFVEDQCAAGANASGGGVDPRILCYANDSSQASYDSKHPINLVYSGINRGQMEKMSVEDIYNKMSHNLGEANASNFEVRCQRRYNENHDIIRQRHAYPDQQPIKNVNSSMSTGMCVSKKHENMDVDSTTHYEQGSPESSTRMKQEKKQQLISEAKNLMKQNSSTNTARDIIMRKKRGMLQSGFVDYNYADDNIIASKKVVSPAEYSYDRRGSPKREQWLPKVIHKPPSPLAVRGNNELSFPLHYPPKPSTCINGTRPKQQVGPDGAASDYRAVNKSPTCVPQKTSLRDSMNSMHKQIWSDGTQTAVLAASSDIFTHSPSGMKTYSRPSTRDATTGNRRPVMWTMQQPEIQVRSQVVQKEMTPEKLKAIQNSMISQGIAVNKDKHYEKIDREKVQIYRSGKTLSTRGIKHERGVQYRSLKGRQIHDVIQKMKTNQSELYQKQQEELRHKDHQHGRVELLNTASRISAPKPQMSSMSPRSNMAALDRMTERTEKARIAMTARIKALDNKKQSTGPSETTILMRQKLLQMQKELPNYELDEENLAAALRTQQDMMPGRSNLMNSTYDAGAQSAVAKYNSSGGLGRTSLVRFQQNRQMIADDMASKNRPHNPGTSNIRPSYMVDIENCLDFGMTPLYEKFVAGENLSQLSQDRDLTKSPGPIGSSELEFLLQLLKQKRQESDISQFLLQSFQILIETMKHLLQEMNLAERFDAQLEKLSVKAQIAEADHGKSLTLEQLWVIGMRARKLFNVRDDLLGIFNTIQRFEQKLPILHVYLQANAHQKDDKTKKVLVKEAAQIEQFVEDLLQRENKLYEIHGFLPRPFIVQGRDYLKYVTVQVNELRRMLAEYGVLLN